MGDSLGKFVTRELPRLSKSSTLILHCPRKTAIYTDTTFLGTPLRSSVSSSLSLLLVPFF